MAGTQQTPLLKIPAVRRMLVASIVSSLGTSMAAVAIAFVAYQRTDSVVLTVVAVSGSALPVVFLAPIAARLSSQYDPRTVCAVVDIAKALVWGTVTVVAVGGGLRYPFLLAASFASGALGGLMSASRPRINELVAPIDRLVQVTALFRTVSSVCRIVGALLGGVLIATAGHAWVFGFDAVSFVPLVVAILLVPAGAKSWPPARHVVRSGLRAIREREALRRAFLLAAVLNLAAWPVVSLLPAIAAEIDDRGHVLGILTGGFYAGAALVTAAVTRLRRRFSYSQVIVTAFLAAGAMLVANAALTGWLNPGVDAVVIAVTTLVPIGLAVSVNATLLQALVQLGSPADEEGGVLVAYAVVAAVVTPLGGILLGAVVDASSLWWSLAVSGVVLVVVTIVLRRHLVAFDAFDAGTRPEERIAAAGDHWSLHLRHVTGVDV